MFSLCPVILLVLLVTHLLSFDAEYSTQVCYSFFFSSRELKTTRNHSSGSPGHCHMAFSWSAFPLKSLLSMANILLFRCLPRLFSSMWPLTISCPASSPPLAFFSFSLGRTTGVKALLVRHCVVVLVWCHLARDKEISSRRASRQSGRFRNCLPCQGKRRWDFEQR